ARNDAHVSNRYTRPGDRLCSLAVDDASRNHGQNRDTENLHKSSTRDQRNRQHFERSHPRGALHYLWMRAARIWSPSSSRSTTSRPFTTCPSAVKSPSLCGCDVLPRVRPRRVISSRRTGAPGIVCCCATKFGQQMSQKTGQTQ